MAKGSLGPVGFQSKTGGFPLTQLEATAFSHCGLRMRRRLWCRPGPQSPALHFRGLEAGAAEALS